MLKYIQGDITEIESGIICQQVNCQSVMGSGLAKAIRDKWPKVFDEYKTFLNTHTYSARFNCLGRVCYYSPSKDIIIANVYGQFNYGREDKRYTNYAALFKGLCDIVDMYSCSDNKIYVPKNIGCGLAHGNWEFVEEYLKDLSEMYHKDIYIVEKV